MEELGEGGSRSSVSWSVEGELRLRPIEAEAGGWSGGEVGTPIAAGLGVDS